jgi:hypothetical protein
MSDDDPKPPPIVDEVLPVRGALRDELLKHRETPAAPAVHGSELWGGPRLVENATAEPVQVDTKQQYWDLLNAVGARMKDQQESTTGPERAPLEAPAPLPPIVVAPLEMDEAHVFGAFEAILRRYRLVASLWCEHCFARNRHHGVRYTVKPDRIAITCRCGTALYTPPRGTTDAVLRTLHLSVTANDTTMGAILTAAGPIPAPTILLHTMEDLLIRRWLVAMRRRGMEPRLFHLGPCHPSRSPHVEDEALAIHMSPEQLILVCQCPRQLFAQRAATVPPVAVH